MEDVIAPAPKAKKKAVKKTVPVGRNGLKKKRIVKSKMTVDSKGYTGKNFFFSTNLAVID